MLALWDLIAALAEAPWSTLQGAALWHLAVCAGFHCPLTGADEHANERRRGALERFNGMFTRTVRELLGSSSWSCRVGGVRIVASFFGLDDMSQPGTGGEDNIHTRGVDICVELATMLRGLREDWCPSVRTSSQRVLAALVSVLGETVLGTEEDDEPLYEATPPGPWAVPPGPPTMLAHLSSRSHVMIISNNHV